MALGALPIQAEENPPLPYVLHSERRIYISFYEMLETCRHKVLCVLQEAFLFHNTPQELTAPADSGADRRFTQTQLRGNFSVGVPQ